MPSAIDPTSDAWEIDVGWAVVTADGTWLGAVEGVHAQHIIVSTSRPTSTMLFVPVDAVADIESDRVYLRVSMADVLSQGWELIPEVDDVAPDSQADTLDISERTHSVLGVGVAVVVTVAMLVLVVSWSPWPLDTAIAVIFLLGVEALVVWVYRLWHGSDR